MNKLVKRPRMLPPATFEVTEDIERHEELNPKLFNADQQLKPEVREKILEIVDAFIENLADSDIPLIIEDIILLGSNASYNYTKDSDLDIHIVAKTEKLKYPVEAYDKLYSAYRSIFNSKFDIKFFKIPVELYVEVGGVPRVSSGVYSVIKDDWLKKPVLTNIPEIDKKAFEDAFKLWEKEVPTVLNSAKTAEEIEDYITKIYEQRQKGLQTEEGEYSIPNLIFKEIRNRGWLDELKDLKNKIRTTELSLESFKRNKKAIKQFIEEYKGLSEPERVSYMHKLARIAHTQALVASTGHFSLHNINEREANRIYAELSHCNWVKDLTMVASGYDFSNPGDLMLAGTHMLPKHKYTISGKIVPKI